MAENNTRFRILCVFDILMQNSDEYHILSIDEIIVLLEGYGIKADKRAVTSDIEIINRFNNRIVSVKKPKKGYYFAFTDEFISDYSLFVALSLSDYADEENLHDFVEKIRRGGSQHRKRILFDTEELIDLPSAPKPNLQALVLIKFAIDRNFAVRLTLKERPLSRYSDEFSKVVIDVFPRKIISYRKRQHLLFSVKDKDSSLYFIPVSRIEDAEEIDAVRVFPEPDPAQAKGYFSGDLLFFNTCSTLLSFTLPESLIDQACFVFGSSLSVRKYETEYRASIDIQLDYSHIGWLVCHGREITIVSPDDLKEKICKAAENL